MLMILSVRVASGQFSAALTRTVLVLPYLAIALVSAVAIALAARIPSGGSQ
jgi:hypothetical protein